MNTIKRSAIALGAVAALTVSLTACGDDASSAPKSASKADFCKAWEGDSSMNNIKEGDYKGMVDAIHKMADNLKKTGTPKGIPADAREGFEVEVKAASKLDADTLKKAMKAADSDSSTEMLGISSSDAKKANAFESYADDLCD